MGLLDKAKDIRAQNKAKQPTAGDALKGAFRSVKAGTGMNPLATSRQIKAAAAQRNGAGSGVTYEMLTELLLTHGSSFEIRSHRSNGKTDVYRGKDVSSFVSSGSHARHSHDVYDASGKHIYSRDYNGKVTVGDERQLRDYLIRAKIGNIASR